MFVGTLREKVLRKNFMRNNFELLLLKFSSPVDTFSKIFPILRMHSSIHSCHVTISAPQLLQEFPSKSSEKTSWSQYPLQTSHHIGFSSEEGTAEVTWCKVWTVRCIAKFLNIFGCKLVIKVRPVGSNRLFAIRTKKW